MLEWYAYYHSWNEDKIEPFNVFDHGSFLEDCKKNSKKNIHDYDAFCEQLRRDAMYYYWSKCEWEIVLAPWVRKNEDAEIKIDVYDQLRLNWEAFCKYTWEHGAELRRRKKKEKSNDPA